MMNTVRAYIYRALHSLSTYACLVMMFFVPIVSLVLMQDKLNNIVTAR